MSGMIEGEDGEADKRVNCLASELETMCGARKWADFLVQRCHLLNQSDELKRITQAGGNTHHGRAALIGYDNR